jgi:hypothetical protein
MLRFILIFVIMAAPAVAQVRAPKKPVTPSRSAFEGWHAKPRPCRAEQRLLGTAAVSRLHGHRRPEIDSVPALGEGTRELSKGGDCIEYDPQGFCLPPAGPRMMTTPYPMEIIQLPEQKRILMIYEGGAHVWRIIYMDGRAHPDGDALNLTWMGHSIGHWENDTLVVDTVGFNEGTWIDMGGKPHTDKMHLVERFTRTDLYTLHYEATIDDVGAYTAPWKVRFDVTWDPNGEIQEYICQENNLWKDRVQ